MLDWHRKELRRSRRFRPEIFCLPKYRMDTNACDTILESGDPNDKIDSLSMMNLRIVIIDKWPSKLKRFHAPENRKDN